MGERRFFVPPSQIAGDEASITGSDVKHIRNVLRLKTGDRIILLDGQGGEFQTQISEISSARVRLNILESTAKKIPERNISLFQGIPRGAKMDFIVQKATELGVSQIVPVAFDRTVVRLEEKAEAKKKRWQKVAEEAAKQANRSTVPEVAAPIRFESALKLLPEHGQVLVFWEAESRRLVSDFVDPKIKNLAIVVGPEGGLTATEIKKMVALGAKTVTAGDFILRTETAAIAALAIVSYELRRQEKNSN